MKKLELIQNNAGGIDLMTNVDAGNKVRILTGSRERSIQYWKEMQEAAQTALDHLRKPKIHVVIINADAYPKRKRSYVGKATRGGFNS